MYNVLILNSYVCRFDVFESNDYFFAILFFNSCLLFLGTGKTFICKKISEHFHMVHQDVSELVKEHNFTDGFDVELNCPFLDEDALLDFLEPIIQKGGNIVEYHSNEFFPERWFHLVLVVTCDTQLLYDRLTARSYNKKKIEQNIQCEIFGTILEEAQASYKPEIIKIVKSTTSGDVNECLNVVEEFFKDYNNKTFVS